VRFRLALVLALFFLAACSGAGPEAPPALPPPLPALEEDAGALARREALAREAAELRRVAAEHRRLIASIPPSPVPAPSPGPSTAERQEEALARVLAHPEGEPVRPGPGESWFDPRRGLTFYRDSGGDWTPRKVREGHTHRGLFYYGAYPEGVLNFADESIHPALARELAFEAARVLPLLGDPTPAMVRSFAASLGWELRDSAGPVVNLWTRFTVAGDGQRHAFAVGGVMRLGVAELGAGEARLEYLTVGEWVGPVVVERLR
jgi:hypothetical protein